MEPQRPPHQRFIRPPSYAGPPQDSRNNPAPPPRPYGPSSSLPGGRPQPPYDPFRRAESETQQSRPSPFSYPMSQHQPKPQSPVPFPPPHSESSSTFHSRQSSHDSIKQHSDGGVKDYNTVYREGHSHQLPRDMPHMSHLNDQSRRQSLGSSGSPPLYPPGPHEHPSSSHSYGNRQMLPPTSPPRYQPHGAPAPPPPPPPPPPSSMTPREQPPHPGHRPGSSMSISSVLGSDTDRPSRDTASSNSGYIRSSIPSTSMATGPPSAGGAMSPPAGLTRHTSDYLPFQGPNSSEKATTSKPQPPRQYRSSSGGIPQAQAPSESSRMGGPPHTQSFSHYGDKPSTDRSPSTQFSETPYNQNRRLSLNGPIQRPNSQPPPEEYPARTPLFSPLSRPSQSLGDTHLNGSQRTGSGYPPVDTQSRNRYSGPFQERPPQDFANREKEGTGPQDIGPKHHQPHPQSRLVSQLQEREAEKPRMPWDSTRSQPASPESKRSSTSGPGPNFTFNSAHDYNNKPPGSQLGTTRPPAGMPHQARQGQPTPPNEGSFLSNALNKLQNQPRVFSPTSAPSGTQQSFGSSTGAEEQQRKGSDELLHHRNLLNINAENKKAGRMSPLPQAVQGAQAQLVGPTGEPGIKNELGRVFSGIGSGVGASAPGQVGSGPPTPATSSPFKRDDAMARSTSGGMNDGAISKVPRAASGTGKRGRKPKEEENKDGVENGTSQRASGTRGGRRGRHVHHHHHHAHHHHHHRRKLEEEANDAAQSRNALLSTPNFPRTATPSDTAGVSSAPASHHHHHHHHHHHVPRTASTVNSSLPPPPPPPPREHNKVVNLQPLLKTVAHLPRQHLGSTLYCPKIDVPTATATPESAKFGYSSTPVPIPRFEGKENCTFTIRVPRFRIDRSHREEICARRAIWGTGVYTDDSDPVAAAIHSGFIRGEWGDDVDISMLDLEIKEQYQHAPQGMALNGTNSAVKSQQDGSDPKKETKIPPVPPADKDLHITLLILPPLEQYDSSVLFGLKSRSWGSNHDGMSFKIEKIDWIDEGVAKGEERGGEARRKRLRTMMNSGRICTGAGMKGKGGIEIRQRKMATGVGNGPNGDAVGTAS